MNQQATSPVGTSQSMVTIRFLCINANWTKDKWLGKLDLISMEASSQSSLDVPGTNRGVIPPETLDHPFDVTLLVEGGKEFKAHRRILSEASTFFKKLLSTDMKKS